MSEGEGTGPVTSDGDRWASSVEDLSVGYLSMDAQWRVRYVNAAAVAALGRRREDMLGGVIYELFPDTAGTAFEAGYRRAAATGVPFVFDAYYPAPLDAWYEVRATPETGGVALYFVDISARVRAQQAAERATGRAELLAAVSEDLSQELDVEQVAARLPHLLVPALGDWCVVSLLDQAQRRPARRPSPGSDPGPGSPRRRVDAPGPAVGSTGALAAVRDVSHRHVDPARDDLLARYARHRVEAHRSDRAADSFLARALRSPRPSVVPTGATDAVAAALPDGPARSALLELAPASAVVVPMRARGRTLGAITLCWDTIDDPRTATPVTDLDADPVGLAVDRGRTTPVADVGWSDVDLATLRSIADRAGLALDNARLYEQQLGVAETLQRSLLTAPPEPDHMQVAVRYQSAAAAAQVGGEWYDAFLQRAGSTVLVIGDVLGHDTAAAAAMGQIRTLLRGTAVITGEGPAHILSAVDAAMRTLQVDTTATAVVARVEQTEDERSRGVTRVRWSNAGHPPPMAVHPDGTTTLMTAPRSELILGVDPGTGRSESSITLDRGATVLLYTDGLVERRGESLEDGLDRLRRQLGELAPLDLDDLCDQLLQRMLPAQADDDVALIAVRLHRQDRPRPAEAGPQCIPDDVPPEPA